MTGINLGNNPITDMKLGPTSVSTVYLGSSLIWQKVAPTKPSFRYIRIDGYGEYTTVAANTSRLFEIEIFSGGINRASGIAGSTDDAVDFPSGTADFGKTTGIVFATNNEKVSTTNYDGWWGDVTLNNNAGNGWLKIDLGAEYVIDSIRYWSYPSRAPRFIIYGTNNLADFGLLGVHGNATNIWDLSLNTTLLGATVGTDTFVERIF